MGDEAQEAKGWFFSKKNKAKDEVKDQADQTSSWLGGKKEQVSCSCCAEALLQPVIARSAARRCHTCVVAGCGVLRSLCLLDNTQATDFVGAGASSCLWP